MWEKSEKDIRAYIYGKRYKRAYNIWKNVIKSRGRLHRPVFFAVKYGILVCDRGTTADEPWFLKWVWV